MKSRTIQIWKDDNRDRSAAENMALDEALFLSAVEADMVRARFYGWSAPAVTLGYFHQGEPVADAVRRMTGGGIVEHGNDLTFTLAYPKDSDFSQSTGAERYAWVHQAISRALDSVGFQTELSASHEQAGGSCFSSPVEWDILDPASGEKIAGGAQRRSRGAVIHQGSIRVPAGLRSPDALWVERFLAILAGEVMALSEGDVDGLCKSARILEAEKYGTREWNGW